MRSLLLRVIPLSLLAVLIVVGAHLAMPSNQYPVVEVHLTQAGPAGFVDTYGEMTGSAVGERPVGSLYLSGLLTFAAGGAAWGVQRLRRQRALGELEKINFRSQIDQAGDRLNAAQQALESHQAQVQQLSADAATAAQQLQTAHAQIQKLKQQIYDLERVSPIHETQQEQQSQAVVQLRQELDTSQSLNHQLRQQLAEETAKVLHQQADIQRLTDQCQTLGLQLADHQSEIDQLLAQLELALQQEDEHRRSITCLEGQLSHQAALQSAQLENLTRTVRDLKRQLRQASFQQQQATEDALTFEEGCTNGKHFYRLRIDCEKDLKKLPSREFKQLMMRILDLQISPRPQDHRPLNKYGYRSVMSIDEGEYRICYSIYEAVEHQLGEVQVLVVDKRNDDKVYNRLRQMLG